MKNTTPAHGLENAFVFPDTGIVLPDGATLLAIDDFSFPIKNNLCLYLTKPRVRAGGVLTPSPFDSDAPDNLAAHFYGTVLHDGGRFRMWYYACHWGSNNDWNLELKRQLAKYPGKLFMGPLCYAESEDGISWVKPELGQVRFKGSSANNVLALPHAVVSAATVLKDEDEPDPARRYKMVYEFFPEYSDPPLDTVGIHPTCAMAVSPDGLKWQVLSTPYPHEFVEHASFYRHDGKYILNSQQIDIHVPGEGGTPRGRQGFARMAYDFDRWVPGTVESFTLPEPADIQQRGYFGCYDQVHLGVGAASFGTVCVGLYGLWHNAHFHNEFHEISCDLGLVVSNDGLHFREPVKGHVFLDRRDSPAPAQVGRDYNTILTQANGILNVGDETRIYHGRWRNAGGEGEEITGDVLNYYAEVALATLPRDRWGGLSVTPQTKEGAVWTCPVILPHGEVELLLNAEGAGGISVEIAGERFQLIADYSGDKCGKTAMDEGFGCKVTWPSGSLGSLGGQSVRFKMSLSKSESCTPRLYALSLSCGQVSTGEGPDSNE